jgi:hypothetical protein
MAAAPPGSTGPSLRPDVQDGFNGNKFRMSKEVLSALIGGQLSAEEVLKIDKTALAGILEAEGHETAALLGALTRTASAESGGGGEAEAEAEDDDDDVSDRARPAPVLVRSIL